MRRQIRNALRNKVKKLRFMDDNGLRMAKRLQRPYKWLTGVNLPDMLKLIEPVHGMMKGKPTDRIIASTYWRKKMMIPQDMDPDRDRCGLIWCAHVAPTKGEHARQMADITTQIMLSHGFEPGMTLTMINERNMDNVISISYDRDVDGEDERAMLCYHELSETLIKKGYYPYRLGTHNMHLFNKYANADYLSLLKQLKSQFDPHQIVAPGRYIP
jgi:4-cresol dehydrogenase (hydroxylating)